MAIALTERDLELLKALHTARYMATEQIQARFFPGRGGIYGPRKICQRRLKQLYEHKLIRRIEPWIKRGQSYQAYIYALDKAGAQTLQSECGLTIPEADWKSKSNEDNFSFLKHTLATNEIHISVIRGCAEAGVTLTTWWDEREIRGEQPDQVTIIDAKTHKESKTAVIPDSAFILAKDDKKSLCWLETDMGTVTIEARNWESKSWTKKILAYLTYQRTDAPARRYGVEHMARILTITTSEQRLQTLKQATERAGGGIAFWFTTFEAVATPGTNLLSSPIWQVAGSSERKALV